MMRVLARLLVIVSSLWIQAVMADQSDWALYKSRFVSSDGRVIDTYNKNISHSEGQGWGMLFAEANNDQHSFDLIWSWTRKNLARTDAFLFSWRYDPELRPAVKDPNNASDGDILIAWALQRAAKRWNDRNYETASAAIRADIQKLLVKDFGGFTVLLPGLTGFSDKDSIDINLSYWVIPALISFAMVEPDQNWSTLVTDGQKLLAASRFGSYSLPSDWIRLSDKGRLAPSPNWPARFSYDAVRIPLYFIWGSALTTDLRQPFADFWKNNELILPWVDVVTGEKASYTASAGIKAVRSLVYNDRSFAGQSPSTADDYYSTSLLMLSKLAADPR
jgi:endoglucanase